MYRNRNNIVRYTVVYFLCLMSLSTLSTTQIHADPDPHRQREQPAGTSTNVSGVTSGNKINHRQLQNPTKSRTGNNADTSTLNSQSGINYHHQSNVESHNDTVAPKGKPDANPRKQDPTKSHPGSNEGTWSNSNIKSRIQKKDSAETRTDLLDPKWEPDANVRKQRHTETHTRTNGYTLAPNSSHTQKLVKDNAKTHGNILTPSGEPETNPQQQKPTKNHTRPFNPNRDPYSQHREQPTKPQTKSYPAPTSASRRRAKRLKPRSLTLPGEIALSDIPVPDVPTSAPAVPTSSTTSNRTLSDAITASNGSGVTRETLPADFTVISVVPSEEAFPKELPLPLLIASPVAAVSIIIFVCVAYCCHSNQLDARARQLALKYAVIATEPPACSRGVPSTSSVDMDLIRKTSLRPSISRTSTPNPTPNGSKRGSMNWVALGDQEVITYTAARRHSTFIL